jgi:hypothetical protein
LTKEDVMIRRLLASTFLIALAAAPAVALSPGETVIVPAAGRGAPWGTDLYVMNPGSATVDVTIYWLVRDQANPNPASISFSLPGGETEVLDDVILNDFGLSEGNGAFLVEADGGEVIANSRIYASDGTATFGQGFEGVPDWAATQAGSTTDVVGLGQNASFRTNVYATAGEAGAVINFSLRDPQGGVLASTALALDAWEPYLKRVNQLFPGLANFDDGTLHAEVTSGLAVVGASKVDNASTDPTTLESAATGGAGGIDGTYQFALYDSLLFAAGGNLVIAGGQVTAIVGTYFNWDKLDGTAPACPLLFQWGQGFTPTPVTDFADGVTFSDSYEPSGSGVMTWTVEFVPGDGPFLEGQVTAVGSEFPSEDAGCNGDFPALVLHAGKTN